MSGALDTLSAEEQAQLRQMEADDAATEPEPQPPSAAEPEPPASGEPPAPREPAMVDKRALDDERNRRQKLQAELAEERRKAAADQARVEERLRLLSEATQAHLAAQAPPAAPPEPVPDFATDPAGFIQHGFKSLERTLTQLGERVQKVESGAQTLTQTQQEQQRGAELVQWGMAQEAEYAREVGAEEYQRAVTYLTNVRERELRAMGYTDPAEIRFNITSDVRGMAALARDRGQQFGRVLYDLAQARGYQKAAPAAASNGGADPSVSHGTPTPPAAPVADTAAERLLRGQDMATTIGGASGAPRGEPAAQHIANMSDAEFEAYYARVAKQGPAAIRNLFGS